MAIIKTVTHDESKEYYCCIDLSRRCVGKKCMGWIEETVKVGIKNVPNRSSLFPPEPIVEKTGKGFCGRINF